LRKLTVNDVVKDFEAINARVAPDGSDDPWSETTLEENLVDLGWHQKEFELQRSFAYTIVAPDESRVLGCAYVNPSETHDARVRMWVRRDAYDDGLDPVVEAALREWLERDWPFERVDWAERD
jgi:hypothetical protein